MNSDHDTEFRLLISIDSLPWVKIIPFHHLDLEHRLDHPWHVCRRSGTNECGIPRILEVPSDRPTL
jgi:hypothetical protein